jgi:hypothetical protein
VDASSSLLAVDVRFPVALGRDPSLVRAYLVKGPIHGGLERLPELVPASFVKGSRAYLVDPEPGTWSLVAVTHAYSPPRNRSPVAGVSDTVADGGDIGNAVVLPSEWIERTRTTVAPGRVAFMGALALQDGERIHDETRFEDAVQERLAESVRPGATSRSGLSGRLSRTWTLDRDRSTFQRGERVREDFLRDAKLDLAGSPWAALLPASAPSAEELASRWTKPVAPAAEPAAPEGVAPASEPRAGVAVPPMESIAPAPSAASGSAQAASPAPEAAQPPAPAPEAAETSPRPADATRGRHAVSRVDRRGPSARIVPGMSHDDVRAILGDPDERTTYLTARALIPFYSGPDAQRRVWIYRGRARVEFSLNSRTGTLRVVRVEGPSAAE